MHQGAHGMDDKWYWIKPLQEPKVVLLRRHHTALEMRDDFREHFWVFDGDGKMLLLDRLPIDATKLIHLFDKLGHNLGVDGLSAICGTLYLDLDWEGIAVTRIENAVFITSVVAKQVGAVAQVDISAAIRH